MMPRSNGSDPNAVESLKDQTALMWATAEGHLEVVDALLNAGADPDMKAMAEEVSPGDAVLFVLVRKVTADLAGAGVTEAEVRAKMAELLVKAAEEIQGTR